MSIVVLFEDNHIIAVNKQPSDIVQGDKTGDTPLSEIVKKYIKIKYNKPGDVFLGVVHRLDRPVSGVILFAKTSKALSRLNQLFQKKEVHKTYWAVTEKATESKSGILEDYLVKNAKQNKSYVTSSGNKQGKRCKLHYEHLSSSDKYHLIQVDPKTGRHHQIRTQLAYAGAIIKGDLKYGAKRSNKDASIHLHAYKIELTHPVSKERLIIFANPPKDPIWDYFWKAHHKE